MASVLTAVILSPDHCCPASPRLATTKPAPRALRALTPTLMQPEWHHAGPTTLTRLRRIERIEVVKAATSGGSATTQEYTVNIYHEQPQSHIPTIMWNHTARLSTKDGPPPGFHRAPDSLVLHSAGHFCSLRNIAHSCVTTDDHTSHCDACYGLSSFMTRGDGRPMAFVGVTLDATGDASAMLARFLNHLLDSCRSQPESDQTHGCRGQRRIALALQDFLFRL